MASVRVETVSAADQVLRIMAVTSAPGCCAFCGAVRPGTQALSAGLAVARDGCADRGYAHSSCERVHSDRTGCSDSARDLEFGSARPLDFGHWAAHKLEQISEYRLRHGEAVAIGLIFAAR